MGSILSFFTGIWGGLSTTAIEIIVILAVLIGGYLYWHHLESTITTLQIQNTQLQGVVNTQNQTITKLQQDFQQEQTDLNNLNQKYQNILSGSQTLAKDFTYNNITDQNKIATQTQANKDINGIFSSLTQITDPDTFQNIGNSNE